MGKECLLAFMGERDPEHRIGKILKIIENPMHTGPIKPHLMSTAETRRYKVKSTWLNYAGKRMYLLERRAKGGTYYKALTEWEIIRIEQGKFL